MVLFVNHRGEEFPLGDNDASGTFAEGVMPADKMPFHEEMFVQSRRFINADVENFIAKVK
jgi:hypothetical protein